MRLPRRRASRRLPWWPASAGPHPKGRWRGRLCWALTLAEPGTAAPPQRHVLVSLPGLFGAPARWPRALVLQERRGRRWTLLARWTGRPQWIVGLEQPTAADRLRLVWSGRPSGGPLGEASLRRAAAPAALSALARLGCDVQMLAYPAELRRLRLLPAGATAPPAGLRIAWYGRFSNNVTQLVQALALAEQTGVPEVAMPGHRQLRLPTGGLEGPPALRAAADSRAAPCLVGGFFHLRQYSALAAVPPERYRDLARSHVRPLLDPALWQAAPSHELVVHLRGGDVFAEGPVHPLYFQPPLAFYRRCVAAERAAGRAEAVRIVSEDRRNPCLAPLAEWLARQGIACAVQTSDFASDLATLLSARHLVASLSSLMGAVALLSRHLEAVYTFHDGLPAARPRATLFPGRPASGLERCGIRHRNVVDGEAERAGGGYLGDGIWRNTPEQRARMLAYPDGALTLV